ncbi:MAG: hypothetical protein KIT84_31875 [Labilithrix sp.]|nr:hypothetical protein [Labilithrix sp.]MCW5815670.1 hypothetical protein [Labilithrix sp.]
MKRATARLIVKAARFLGYGVAAAGVYVAAKEASGLVRYAAIKRMAKSSDGADPKLLPSDDCPQYSQAPRRVGEHDRNRGSERRAEA